MSAPASLLLVHGAGSGPWVFDEWYETFPGLAVHAVDLQEGLDVAAATMSSYASNVEQHAARLPHPVTLCGWSMGGLVVLQAAERAEPHSVVVIEPSPPAEVQGVAPDVEPAPGSFDPETVYGRFPPGMRARPESELARGERKRGISVPRLACSSLVVYGREYAEERGRPVAELYGSQEAFFPELDHWQLVRSVEVRRAIAAFLGVS